MKKLSIILLLMCLTPLLSAQKPEIKSGILNTIPDKISSYPTGSVKIEGYLGDKINLVISQRIKTQDVDQLVEPFRHKNETHLWQSEFWGKWIQSAIAAYSYNHDPGMFSIIKKQPGICSTLRCLQVT